MLAPIQIDDVRPRTPTGFPAKGTVGERLPVSATIFTDGHPVLDARIRWRHVQGDGPAAVTAAATATGATTDVVAPLRHVGNDRWETTVEPSAVGRHELVIEVWVDRYATWRHEVEVKAGAHVELSLELEEGALLLEELAERVPAEHADRVREAASGLRREGCTVDARLNAGLDDHVAEVLRGLPDARFTTAGPYPVRVERRRAAVGAWYELFPRSEGGLVGATARLDAIAEMGFDVVYLPPIHPIGHTNRKGRDNTLTAQPGDPGSPWAIGSAEGGHTAIHPELGSFEDFERFVRRAEELGMEVALDYALQCSADHPWVREHPEWFQVRADGSIRYAENPPKKYQDIHPLEFWPPSDEDRVALWEACRDVVELWIARGVRIFRVDNPHTKPLAFWAWMIADIARRHPDVVLLAEAFTRPAMMAKLAEVGFSQSYTYFTWRTQPEELRDYVVELTQGPLADYFRPAFWPNTPDILSGPLRHGPPAAFQLRLVLAATLAPTYGIYSGYELCENEPANDQNEEYARSEKYELRVRDWSDPRSLAPFIGRINTIRRAHDGLWALRDVRFHRSENDRILVYSRGHAERDLLVCCVNLDPHRAQETTVHLDVEPLGLPRIGQYSATDELTGEAYTWSGSANYVRLDPDTGAVAHVLHVKA